MLRAHAKAASARACRQDRLLGRARLLKRPQAYRPLRSFSSSRLLNEDVTLGIRAEDAGRIWERRTPLTPDHVGQLVRNGVKVLVQPSAKRVFRDQEYSEAGASLTSGLDKATIILGIKEVPAQDLLPPSSRHGRTYCLFSHTHKGQAYNRPLLKAMLDSQSSYVDWELLTDDQGARTTAFGHLAGVAGAAEALSGLGIAALKRGMSTPFLNLPRPYVAGSVAALDQHLASLRAQIENYGTPAELGPVTVGLTGRGRVGQGAKYVLDQVGAQWVSASELESLVKDTSTPRNTIYASQLRLEDYLSHRNSNPFDRAEYNQYPERFHSRFDSIAPFLTLFINGAFWNQQYPRILSNKQLYSVLQRVSSEKRSTLRNRMLGVSDISCDFEGGLEFVTRATTICDPYYYVGSQASNEDDSSKTQVISIEILPSELALDASQHFSDAIFPYVQALTRRHGGDSSADPKMLKALERAMVCSGGSLRPQHEWLSATLPAVAAAEEKPRLQVQEQRKILMLGAGMVAGPAVDCLLRRSDVNLTVASNVFQDAEALVKDKERARAVDLDVGDVEQLERLIKESEVVISLLPATLHPRVAEICIAQRKHLVTASYISPAMKTLHPSAEQAGVVLLSELGLDPGIDHLLVMSLLDQARREGLTVESFVSFCGGLPAPEHRGVPLDYKFSWSPMGVLSAAQNDAKFRLNGQLYEIPGTELLNKTFAAVPAFEGFDLEGLANRDSLSYLSTYGLDPELPTILRGTLRYPGFSSTMSVLRSLGLLSSQPFDASRKPSSWSSVLPTLLGGGLNIQAEVSKRVPRADDVQTLERLGLLGSTSDLPPFPRDAKSPVAALATLLSYKLRYLPGERDLVLLSHELGVRSRSGAQEVLTSSLVAYGSLFGSPGYSAMATTVGLPVALGALLVLDGGVSTKGVMGPTSEDIWRPLLESLEKKGLKIEERRVPGNGMVDVLGRQMEAHFGPQH